MATVQEIIEAAYNRSTANDAGKLAQDPELIPHLDRLYQRFYALFARQRPNLATTRTYLTLMGNPASALMSPVPIDLRFIFNEDQQEVNLIDNTERERTWHLAPSVYREGARIVSRAKGGDPVACDILELTVIDTPVTLAALDTLVDPRFPVRHHQLLIDSLAMYLATKDDGREAAEVDKLMKEYSQALGAFASEFEIEPEALQWAHAPVKRKPAVGGAAA